MKIGIIGIGHMGKNISRRLVPYVQLVLYNRTYEKAEAWGFCARDSRANKM